MVGVFVAVAGSVLRVVFVESVASAPTVGSAEYVAPSESSDTRFFGDSASQKTSAESVALSVLVASVDFVVLVASAEPAELPKIPDLSASAVLVETLSAKASRLFM